MALKPNYLELNKLREKIPNHGFYYPTLMKLSPAYQELAISARNLL
jgi:hypothetical protein